MSSEKQGSAIDLSHHLSHLSRARGTSPLKGLAKYFGKEGLISLAGGMPHPDYFPFANVSASGLVPDSFSLDPAQPSSSLSWFWRLFGSESSKVKTTPLHIPKYPADKDEINLAVALQYGTAQGIPQLQKFIKEFTAKVYQPAYKDWANLVQTGNTDAWSRAFQTLCNPGELFLTEEWTYPSALASALPFNVKPVSVAMDKEGLRGDDLRKVLSEWDEVARGAKRPHVLYTVPVGQNPSGATMGAIRKKEIYDICVKFDVIIVEDDPYFFIQQGPYLPKSERSSQSSKQDTKDFVSSLAPSFLKFDYQGRVVRLDTFSKTIAPGSRLGFFTCNAVFAERLERQGETSAQAPCGLGQSLIAQLLITWGQDSYLRWLQGLTVEYKTRRDFFIDLLSDEFHLRETVGKDGIWDGMRVFEASSRPKKSNHAIEKFDFGTKMFSFVPPTSGMFLWVTLHFEELPSFKEGDEDSLEMKLWTKLAEGGVLVAPGWYFSPYPDAPPVKGEGHLRISFSNAEFDTLKRAVEIMGEVFRDFYKQ